MKLRTDMHANRPSIDPSSIAGGSVKDILLEVLELEASERAAFISHAVHDPQTRQELFDLVAAHERAGDFMSDVSAGQDTVNMHDERPGATVGRYTLERLIGEGGFGRVFLARQTQPVVRQVAVKILKPGMDSGQIVARFRAERQSLAMMDHPGIARVFDAGTTSAGRPYFVMELAEGVPITQYCEIASADLHLRLDLFSQACHAVQHAHTKGVIHRDLKPGNLLVTERDGRPQVKVIDFGISKAIGGVSDSSQAMTERHVLVGTPQYMSPEQADLNAADVDTRSDVYSLGVVLYELLAGSTPLDEQTLRHASFDDMRRLIRESSFDRPSTRLSASAASNRMNGQPEHAERVRRLSSQVRGDLDWITLKALEKDRERRYGSPAEFADDIERHLHHEPVRARPPGMAYKLSKFVRRNRAGVIAAGLVGLAMIGGIVGTGIGLAHARDSAQQAAAVRDFMTEFLVSADPDQRGADVLLVDVLDDASLAASERFAGHPELEAQVRCTLGKIYSSLSRHVDAEQEFRRAVELASAVKGDGNNWALHASIGLGQSLLNQERWREAEQLMADAMPRIEAEWGVVSQPSLEARSTLAEAMRQRGHLDESEAMLEDAIAMGRAGHVDEHTLATLINRRTATLRQRLEAIDANQREDALESYRLSAQELLECGLRLDRRGSSFVRAARLNLADIAFVEQEFEVCAAQCHALLQESAGTLGECHASRVNAMMLLARSVNRLGDAAQAANLYAQVIDCTRTISGNDSMRVLALLSDALPIFDRAERWSDGERAAREVIERLEAFGGGHVGTLFYEAYLAHFISAQGRLDDAGQAFDALIAQLGDEHDLPSRLRCEMAWARHLIRVADYEQAATRLQTVSVALEGGRVLTAEFPDELQVVIKSLDEAREAPKR